MAGSVVRCGCGAFSFSMNAVGCVARVHLLQRADRHVRVNLRGLDVLVSEGLLDIPDVGSVLVSESVANRTWITARIGAPSPPESGTDRHPQTARPRLR
jgi:hypothetical protein